MQTMKYRMILGLFRLFRIRQSLTKKGVAFQKMLVKMKKENRKRITKKAVKAFTDGTFTVEGRTVYHFSPKTKERNGAVLYVFGGGFMMSATNADLKWARTLSDMAGMEVFLPIYPLIPDGHTVEDEVLFLDAVYDEILKRFKKEEVRFLGFSAGASLIPFYFTYLLKEKKEGKLPRKAYLSSPAWEIPPREETLLSMKESGKKDPLIPEELFVTLAPYLIKEERYAYMAKPMEVSLSGLCPLHVTYGERESMRGYEGPIRAQAERDGFPLEISVKKDMVHCYQVLTMTEEGRAGQRDLILKIKEG